MAVWDVPGDIKIMLQQSLSEAFASMGIAKVNAGFAALPYSDVLL